MNPTHNDLPAQTRETLVPLLNARLADSLDLFNQLKQAHWNVKGPSFIALHELFDTLSEHARDWADDLAERAVALGGTAEGTVQFVGERSTLPIYATTLSGWRAHVEAITASLAKYATEVRAAIKTAEAASDADTADLFTEISRAADKDLWFVEAHLQD